MSKISLRWYQKEGIKKTLKALKAGENPVGVFPTGSGKTIVMASIAHKLEKNILVLSHRSEILKQNRKAISSYTGEIVGLYSAGLGEKTLDRITVAGIQSVYRNPELFKDFELAIIDEAHLINNTDTGMYRSFLRELNIPFFGLTATPFRTGQGYIYKGEQTIFTSVSCDYSSTDNYNKIVSDGYLSEMYARKTKFTAETEQIGIRGGDFKKEEISILMDRKIVTEIACKNIIDVAEEEELSKWLIFAIDIEHATHIHNTLKSLGVSIGVVHSNISSEERTVLIEQFRYGVITALVNVDMLTTGLDIPDIDLISILRPTNSPSLHVQMLGRGARVVYASGYDLSKRKQRLKAIANGPKPYCIILDFAGNINRLGAINNVHVPDPQSKAKGKGQAMTKECGECQTLNHIAAKECEWCGFRFPVQEKISPSAHEGNVIASGNENGKWLEVKSVSYNMHANKHIEKPASMRVRYQTSSGLYVNEYICPAHGGYAAHKARAWMKAHLKKEIPLPRNAYSLFKARHLLRMPEKILVQRNGNFINVISHQFPHNS